MFCLVLLDPATAPADATEAQLAHVLGMSPERFASEVRPRLPCLVARGLDETSAQTQLIALQAAGATALMLPDSEPLAWLHRGQRAIGPLPQTELRRFAVPGDYWCRVGDTAWLPWPDAATPSQMTFVAAKKAPATRTRHALLGSAVGIAALLLIAGVIALGWKIGQFAAHPPSRQDTTLATQSSTALPDPSAGRSFDPPMQESPLHRRHAYPTTDAHMECAAPAPAATNDEDRYLMASGQRQLTGTAQRKGATYLRLAIIGFDARCRPNAQQAYVFHHGVLLGTLLSDAINLPTEQLDQVTLIDETHVRYTLKQCDRDGAHCKRDSPLVSTLVHSASGWNLVHGNGTQSSFTIVDQAPPRYPPLAMRQRHQGTITLLLLLDVNGQLQTIKIEHSSGWPELDQAAIDAARQWRYAPVVPDGAKPAALWIRVPVAFHLNVR